MRTTILSYLIPLFLIAVACDTQPAATGEHPPIVVPEAEFAEPIDAATYQADEVLYTWVNGLNVRESPAATAKRVARVTPADPLTFTGVRSDQAETIVLRGVAYKDVWYQVSTAGQVSGWVFGGAIKRKEERKGNKELTDQQFDFPAFGSFNLKDWTAVDAADNSDVEGDVSRSVLLYEREDQRLSVERIDRGEYGYEQRYVLTDLNNTIRKERTFSFETDPQLMLVETVVDHQPIPAITYSRTQPLDKHFMQLNEKPLMASGAWVEREL